MRPDKDNPDQSQVPERLGQEEDGEGETEEEDSSSAGGSSFQWSGEESPASGEEEGVDYYRYWSHWKGRMRIVRYRKDENDQ